MKKLYRCCLILSLALAGISVSTCCLAQQDTIRVQITPASRPKWGIAIAAQTGLFSPNDYMGFLLGIGIERSIRRMRIGLEADLQWLNLFTDRYPRRNGAIYDGQGILDPGYRVNPHTFSPGLSVYVCQYLPLNFWLQATGGLRYDQISEPHPVQQKGLLYLGNSYYELTRSALGFNGGLTLGYDITFKGQKLKIAPTVGLNFYHVDGYTPFLNYVLGAKATVGMRWGQKRG